MKRFFCLILFCSFSVLFTACNSGRVDNENILNPPAGNLFEQEMIKTNDNDNLEPSMQGGYGMRELNFPENREFVFSGQEIELSFVIESNDNATIGLMLFIEGLLQPHSVVASSNPSLSPLSDDKLAISYHKVNAHEAPEFTLSFIPVVGIAGETLTVEILKIWQADYQPKNLEARYGFYQEGSTNPPVKIKMELDSTGSLNDERILPEYSRDTNDQSGSTLNYRLYFNESNTLDSLVRIQDNKLKFNLIINGPYDSDIRIMFFANYKVLPINGHDTAIVLAKGKMNTAMTIELDITDLPASSSFFAVFTPIGKSYANNYGNLSKYSTIHLVDPSRTDLIENGDNPADTGTRENIDSPTALVHVDDQNLLLALSNNSIKLSGTRKLGLDYKKNLLVWSGEGKVYKIDPSTGSLLAESSHITEDGEIIAFHYLNEGFAVFRSPGSPYGEKEHRLELYDSDLNLVSTVLLNELFDVDMPTIIAKSCDINLTGSRIACPVNNHRIRVVDLNTMGEIFEYDFEAAEIEIRLVNSISFIENTHLIAFTVDIPSNSAYGLIDMEDGELKYYETWQIVCPIIQQSSGNVYFREALRRPEFPLEGKVVKVNISDFTSQIVSFEKGEANDIYIPSTGKYLFTRVFLDNNSDKPTTKLRIYSIETGDLFRTIDVPYFYPSITFDTVTEILYVANWDGVQDYLYRYSLNER